MPSDDRSKELPESLQQASSENRTPQTSDNSPWDEPVGPPRESCISRFDELLFCYSPVFQMQQLYRYGDMDNCQSQLTQLWQCLKKRTKYADQVIVTPKQTLWRLRSPEEAAQWWKAEFGPRGQGR